MKRHEIYAVERGQKPFDWNRFLNRKTIGNVYWSNAQMHAANWVTCACGNLCNIVPRNWWGEPIDGILRKEGFRFSAAIEQRKIEKAKVILEQIEKRSAVLIAKELKK